MGVAAKPSKKEGPPQKIYIKCTIYCSLQIHNTSPHNFLTAAVIWQRNITPCVGREYRYSIPLRY